MKKLLIPCLFMLSCGVAPLGPTAPPTASPEPSPTPVPVVQCRSVVRASGACHTTSEDVYITPYRAAVAAAVDGGLLFNGEIRNGPAYLQFIIDNLRSQGLCAAIYENEEIAVWSKTDQSFSENWDAIAEPANGGIYPRTGTGAHSWTCVPPTTEAGS